MLSWSFLPFVPVMPMIGPSKKRDPSSSSLMISAPRFRAESTTGASDGTPGLNYQNFRRIRPRRVSVEFILNAAALSSAAAEAKCVSDPDSAENTFAPCIFSSNAAARPLFAAPITTNVFDMPGVVRIFI